MFFVMIDLSEGTFLYLHANKTGKAGIPLLWSQLRQPTQKLNHNSTRISLLCDKHCEAEE
jgi:hypothetical protein